MHAPNFALPRVKRHARLAAGLAAALGLTLATAEAQNIQRSSTGNVANLTSAMRAHAPASAPAHGSNSWRPSFTSHTVTTCADDGSPGSLREIIADVANTLSGDAIDLTQLPIMCSAITLDPAQGQIDITQDSLYLLGPGEDQLTIGANHLSRVLYHAGAGTLAISGTTIADGTYDSPTWPAGGCIYSAGNVSLLDSAISNCTVISSSGSLPAVGAGVFAAGVLTLTSSRITDSHAFAHQGADAHGGAAFTDKGFIAHDSEISHNSSVAIGGGVGYAGGVIAFGSVDIESSTLSGNSADGMGALELVGNVGYTATITNSTISGNSGSLRWGGVWSNVPLALSNSTIAFNHSPFGTSKKGDGLYVLAHTTLSSSIIAGNWRADGQSDLDSGTGVSVTGSNNLITSSAIPFPPGTITTCPQLEPLLDNGGKTRTHALRHTSPAIDQGDAGTLTVDQRGAQRTVGIAADIGSVERQPGETDERVFVGGFDALCDQ